MPVRELDPDKGSVDEYGPGTHTVDVSTEDEIDIEVFGAAGQSLDVGPGGRGGYAIGRGYDVSDVSSLELIVADGRSGYLNGGQGGKAQDFPNGGDGGGLTVVKRGDITDIAGHGGGGGSSISGSGGGGGGAAGGAGGRGGAGASDGKDGASAAAFADLGGDGGETTFDGRDPSGHPGTGEMLTPSRFDSTDTDQQGNDAHEGLIRIERTPAVDVDITSTNSPVKLGETLEVDADVTNLEDGAVTVEVELEIEPA